MIKFGNPENLYLLFLIPIGAVFYFFVFRWKKRALALFGNMKLVEKLTQGISRPRQVAKVALILGAFFFIVLALARPQMGTSLEEVQREGVDILVAIDVSLSMNAKDIAPTRLEKAKHEVTSLLKVLKGDRVGIVAFAGDAFLHCPLTLDYGAAKLFIDILEPGIIPDPGTAIDRAIEVAMRSFESKERKYKAAILITDGENHTGDLKPLLEKAQGEGVVIYTVGVGSPEGVPIPLYDEYERQIGFKKDRSGAVVTTKLDELTLEKIALHTGGRYFRATGAQQELTRIYDEISKMEKKDLGAVRYTQFEERYQFFLAIAIMMLLLEFLIPERKKVEREWKGRFS